MDTYTESANRVAEIATLLSANRVLVNKEYEVNEQRRDATLEMCLNDTAIQVKSSDDKCIFAPGSIVNKQGSYFKVCSHRSRRLTLLNLASAHFKFANHKWLLRVGYLST